MNINFNSKLNFYQKTLLEASGNFPSSPRLLLAAWKITHFIMDGFIHTNPKCSRCIMSDGELSVFARGNSSWCFIVLKGRREKSHNHENMEKLLVLLKLMHSAMATKCWKMLSFLSASLMHTNIPGNGAQIIFRMSFLYHNIFMYKIPTKTLC